MLHMSELFLMGNNNSGNYKIPLVHSVRRGVSLFNKCELTLVAANWPMWWPESATLHVKTGIGLTKNDNQRQIISQSQPVVMNMLSHRRLRTSTFASQHTKMNENKKKYNLRATYVICPCVLVWPKLGNRCWTFLYSWHCVYPAQIGHHGLLYRIFHSLSRK